MKLLSHILAHKLVAIIRGAPPRSLLAIAHALRAGGIRTLEVTLNSPGALAAIAELAGALGEEVVVGAGTVLDPETARAALLAGARFIVSPTLNKKTIRLTKRYGAVSIPGAFTATEILAAYEYGGDLIKVFPASAGGPAYLKDLAGPLPFIPLMPTGGVTLGNILGFAEAGAAAFGLGSALVDARQAVTEEYLRQLTERARLLVAAVV